MVIVRQAPHRQNASVPIHIWQEGRRVCVLNDIDEALIKEHFARQQLSFNRQSDFSNQIGLFTRKRKRHGINAESRHI